MKRIYCEVCGGKDILKDNGVFVCQSCGCQYSLEEVRKMVAGDASAAQPEALASSVDSAEEYRNMLKATRDAMADGRFDSAYANSVYLIAMKPDIPELIAIQALAILGNEKISFDIPSATVRGMERFYTLFEEWKADYAEQVAAILNVRDYVCNACQAQDAMLRETITELESRIQSESLIDNLSAVGDTIGMLGGDFYSTIHGLERESEQRQRDADNESIEQQIEKTREKQRKVDDFRRRQIDSLAELLKSRQETFSEENKGIASETASPQGDVEMQKYKIVSLNEIMCGKCGSVQPMRRKDGICWKCGFKFSD